MSLEHVCKFTKNVECIECNKCGACGWNPAVSKKRLAKIIKQMQKQEKK